jgi:hypothetical protein
MQEEEGVTPPLTREMPLDGFIHWSQRHWPGGVQGLEWLKEKAWAIKSAL